MFTSLLCRRVFFTYSKLRGASFDIQRVEKILRKFNYFVHVVTLMMKINKVVGMYNYVVNPQFIC